MRKNDKFEGLWEDEESIKMQKAIRKNALEERKRIYDEKEDRKTLVIIILGAILFVLMFALLLVKCNNDYDRAVKGCVENGHSRSYCEAKYL